MCVFGQARLDVVLANHALMRRLMRRIALLMNSALVDFSMQQSRVSLSARTVWPVQPTSDSLPRLPRNLRASPRLISPAASTPPCNRG